VIRDVDVFKRFDDIAVGLSITTDQEEIRRVFEKKAPSIKLRIEALQTLHDSGITTYAFIGPMLPLNPARLLEMLRGVVDEVLIDRLNYSNKVAGLYRKAGLDQYLSQTYFTRTASALKEGFEGEGIPVSLVF
jgi:DNA repair photolyase